MTKAGGNLFKHFLEYIGRDEIRDRIQDEIIDPLLNHIMKRVFPYIILSCIFFILLLIVALMTLGIIVFQIRRTAVPGVE